MAAVGERTRTERVTREEPALARAVLDGLPVDGPLLRVAPALPRQRRSHDPRAGRAADPVGEAAAVLDVLASGRDRLARLAALLDAAAAAGPVLR